MLHFKSEMCKGTAFLVKWCWNANNMDNKIDQAAFLYNIPNGFENSWGRT